MTLNGVMAFILRYFANFLVVLGSNDVKIIKVRPILSATKKLA